MILESIPTSIQVLAGFTAISGAGWAWFVRPRIAGMVAEAVGENRKEFAEAMGENRKALAVAMDENRKEVARFHKELSREIAETRKDLTEQLQVTRRELSEDIAANRNSISRNRDLIDSLHRDLSQEIADNRDSIDTLRRDLSQEIGRNRDSITATRDLVSTARVETRDLLAEMRNENHQAHEAIGERINGLQLHITQESTALRTKIGDLKSDTAKLAGAVEVLTTATRGSNSA